MPEDLMRDVIIIERRTQTAQDAYGDSSYSWAVISESQLCRIEEPQSLGHQSQYRHGGQRDNPGTKVYLPSSASIERQDKVYLVKKNGVTLDAVTFLGIVRDVYVAGDTYGNVLHYELDIERA